MLSFEDASASFVSITLTRRSRASIMIVLNSRVGQTRFPSHLRNWSVPASFCLKDRPKADQALPLLQRVASLVKPIMRKHGWVLPVLAEFFPESPNLVGLNVNGGQKILLRLRPAHAPDTFFDEESIVHTMLHELTHNVHGPHDEKFYKCLSSLEDEYDALKRSGYAGEGFFSKGHRLGTNVSHNLPPHVARQKALEAAEKRRRLNIIMNGGGRVGGSGVRNHSNKSPRELAAEAAERRARDEKACASGPIAQREAEKAAKESIEDKVIDLTDDADWESPILTQDASLSVAEPFKDPVLGNITRPVQRSSRASSNQGMSPSSANTAPWPCPQCTLMNEANTTQCAVCDFVRPRPVAKRDNQNAAFLSNTRSNAMPQPSLKLWSCPQCTLENDGDTHRCAACDSVRPNPASTEGWSCIACGEAGMPAEFWSCRFCGTIKTQS